MLALNTTIPESYSGLRFDQALAKCFPEHSRNRLAQWIKSGQATLNDQQVTVKHLVQGGEVVNLRANIDVRHDDEPQAIALDIIYEDQEILVVNKPAGLVVHPAAGNHDGTLLNALLYHVPTLKHLPRAGIIHRLDKDTTGLMIIAKTLTAHTALVASLAEREIERCYMALVAKELICGKTIDAPIGRHLHHRTKMAVVKSGKPARTHIRCQQRFHGFTLLSIKLETGRTHQIRVHLSHENMPIVGDSAYGWRVKLPKSATLALQTQVQNFKRQALHAYRLALVHPTSLKPIEFEAPLPNDFKTLVESLIPI